MSSHRILKYASDDSFQPHATLWSLLDWEQLVLLPCLACILTPHQIPLHFETCTWQPPASCNAQKPVHENSWFAVVLSVCVLARVTSDCSLKHPLDSFRV